LKLEGDVRERECLGGERDELDSRQKGNGGLEVQQLKALGYRGVF
jgi:hypothetical protein